VWVVCVCVVCVCVWLCVCGCGVCVCVWLCVCVCVCLARGKERRLISWQEFNMILSISGNISTGCDLINLAGT